MKNKKIEFTRVNSDSNGNPRYACHFLNLICEQDELFVKSSIGDSFKHISVEYSIAVARAKKLGGRKFHNKQFGGGIVFQSYNIRSTEKDIIEFLNNVQYVQFLNEKDRTGIFAYFPFDDEGMGRKGCYAHVGQHSVCHPDYAKECKPAKRKQYKDLKNELEQIGYNLEII